MNARKAGDEDYERKRLAIVAAAAAVFKEKGYEATNVENIAQKAGIDRASIYYYYKGKTELFRQMVAGAVAGNVEMAEAIAAGEGDPPLKLRKLIEGLFESYERHFPYLFIYVQEDMPRLISGKSVWGEEMKSLSRRFDIAVVKILKAGLDGGWFRSKGDERLIAAGVIGMCNWSHRWYEPGRKQDRAHIAEVFSDMVLNGLAAASTAG
jgi:AcrR family transcriptional regulator